MRRIAETLRFRPSHPSKFFRSWAVLLAVGGLALLRPGGLPAQDEEFGDTLPPVCTGVPRTATVDGAPVRVIDATATDDRPGDSGVLSVRLASGAVNLRCDGCDPSEGPSIGLVLYGVNSGDDGLSILDASTGAVRFVGPLDPDEPNAFATPVAMAARPADGTLFVWNNSSDTETTGDLVIADRCTGIGTKVGPPSEAPLVLGALAFTRAGRLFGLLGDLYEINTATGAATRVGEGLGISGTIAAADFDSEGTLYGVTLTLYPSTDPPRLYTIDTTDGTATLVGELRDGEGAIADIGTIGSIVFAPDGRLLGSAFGGASGGILFEINPFTATVGEFLALDTAAAPQGMGFAPACSVAFRLRQSDPSLDARGEAVASDAAGNTCRLPADFTVIDEGPLSDQILCSGEGVLLSVSGEAASSDSAACVSQLPSEGDPALPPGYEFSPSSDPFPCRVLTIASPLSGPTEMVYKKDGTFEPNLRLLFSRFDGTLFPPFTDITVSVEEIATLVPDPTRLSGVGKWSQVKVACATVDCGVSTASTTCGIGACERTVPTCVAGVPQVCTPGDPAPETCNGIDDDCDGTVDEGAVTGAEVCDGRDNDCDGAVDEALIFGGYLQPVNSDGTSIFTRHRNGTIPLKFRLTNCAGAFVPDAVATLQVEFLSGSVAGTVLETDLSAGNSNVGNQYRYELGSNQYVFNLTTTAFTQGPGTYRATTTIRSASGNDVSTHSVTISLR